VNTTMEPDYNDTRHVIYKLAHAFSQATGHDASDLISAGNAAWSHAATKWDPSRNTKFSSYLYRVCSNAMWSHMRKFDTPTEWVPGVMDVPSPATQYQTHVFWEWVEGLKDDTQYLVHLALDNPIGKLELEPETINKPRKLLSALKQHLRDTGWSEWRIITALADLRYQLA